MADLTQRLTASGERCRPQPLDLAPQFGDVVQIDADGTFSLEPISSAVFYPSDLRARAVRE